MMAGSYIFLCYNVSFELGYICSVLKMGMLELTWGGNAAIALQMLLYYLSKSKISILNNNQIVFKDN